MFPVADETTRKRYRQQFPNDFEYMAQRIKVRRPHPRHPR
jgi:hypothetical protein